MLFDALTVLALMAVIGPTEGADEVHGAGAQGSIMGPVSFLWPADRPWSASDDNVAPCGSSSGVTNRTIFPLGTPGSVALSIGDEAWQVAFRIAYGNNPTTQDVFTDIVGNISEIDPGHQCYPVASIPSSVSAGSNATLQLEYWANDSNKNESFFACADITFVQASAFTLSVPCFNVTASEFDTGSSSSSSTTSLAGASVATSTSLPIGSVQTPATDFSDSSTGLSADAKAGIAIGSIFGGLAVIGAIVFMAMRKHRASKKDAEAAAAAAFPPMKKTASLRSDRTAVAV